VLEIYACNFFVKRKLTKKAANKILVKLTAGASNAIVEDLKSFSKFDRI
jgi:hypothetical protein